MPEMRSSNQCQGQLSCGGSHNKSRLLWLESEAPPREVGKLLGISYIQFLFSLPMCLLRYATRNCVCGHRASWVSWGDNNRGDGFGSDLVQVWMWAGAMLRAVCLQHYEGDHSQAPSIGHSLLPPLTSIPNKLPGSHRAFSSWEGKAQAALFRSTYPTVKNCLISCLRDLISCLYSPIRSFLPSTMQVRFGRGLYL